MLYPRTPLFPQGGKHIDGCSIRQHSIQNACVCSPLIHRLKLWFQFGSGALWMWLSREGVADTGDLWPKKKFFRYGGSQLESQHLCGRCRRVISLRPAWATREGFHQDISPFPTWWYSKNLHSLGGGWIKPFWTGILILDFHTPKLRKISVIYNVWYFKMIVLIYTLKNLCLHIIIVF